MMPTAHRHARFATLVAVLLPVAAGAAEPRLAAERLTHEFGAVERGTRVEHTFTLPNRGDAWLVIDHVKSTCGCSVAVLSAHEIPPGGEARVAVSLDTAELAGHTTKVINVHSNDPNHPIFPLTLTGEVFADFVLQPSPLYLGRVRRGERIWREVLITPGRPGPPALVTAVEHASPMLRTRIEPRAEGPGQRLVVELDRTAPLGRFHDEIRLRTTSEREPVVRLTVFGSVEGDLAVLPPQVTFGVARAAEAPEREVFIRNRGSRPVVVTRVTVPDVVSYELEPLRPGIEWRLVLRLRAGLKPGRIESAVEILTDHPDEERVVVPIFAIVRRG